MTNERGVAAACRCQDPEAPVEFPAIALEVAAGLLYCTVHAEHNNKIRHQSKVSYMFSYEAAGQCVQMNSALGS